MRPPRILCIDDDETVLTMLRAVLELEGYEVRIAKRTSLGLELLRTEPPDLVLTDLRIDELDGMDMLKAVKAIDPEIVVIMLTGYASLQTAIQAMRAGAYDYLLKPVDVDELTLTIARGLEKRGLTLALKARIVELDRGRQGALRREREAPIRRGDSFAEGYRTDVTFTDRA